MYARSNSIIAPTNTIDRGLEYVEDQLMRELLAIEGCVGLSALADRTTGRCIVTSAWDTEQAMQASGRAEEPLRDHTIASFGAIDADINEWEIAVLHRDHESNPGACARVAWYETSRNTMDAAIDTFKAALIDLEELHGFCSASLLVNRATGEAVSTTIYDTARALTETRAPASTLRSDVAEQAGAEIIEINEFELAVAHLRVPELV
jgi:heme-degrading monooxygenase HmoA